MDEAPMAATPPSPMIPDMDDLVRKAEQQTRQLASLKEATSSFLRRDARLSQLRERTLLLRSRAKFEWKNCHDYRRFVRQSQEAFNEKAAEMMSPSEIEDDGVRVERLHNLHDQVMRDFDAQNMYAERANALQTELGDLEYELQTKEISVKNAADQMKQILNVLVLPGDSSAATAVETEVPPSPSTVSSGELSPLIDNYFQKAGFVNVLTERSVDLEVDYADARAERDFKAEHDQILDLSAEDFELSWQKSRDEIAYQLAEARRKADTARNACLDDGLDPDKHRNRPRRESDLSLSDSRSDEISRLLPPDINIQTLEDVAYNHGIPSSDDGNGAFPVFTAGSLSIRASYEPNPEAHAPVPLKDRVLDWIQDINGDMTNATYSGASDLPELLPRRSISDSSPLSQSPGSRLYPPMSRLLLSTWRNGTSKSGKQKDQSSIWLRRRFSEADVADLLSSHDANEGLAVISRLANHRRWQ